ncbi:MAG: hypothetical protein AAF752_11565 [Bacteroidota bacterium]
MFVVLMLSGTGLFAAGCSAVVSVDDEIEVVTPEGNHEVNHQETSESNEED